MLRRSFGLVAAVALAALVGAGCKSNEDASTKSGSAPAPTAPSAPVSAAPVSSAVARVQVQISMRTSDHLGTLRDVVDGKADATAVRAYFEPGPAGDAPAAAQFDTLTKLAKDGWKVQRFEVRTVKVQDDLARATAEVFEWLTRGETSQCRKYLLPWILREDVAYRQAAIDVREAPCPPLAK